MDDILGWSVWVQAVTLTLGMMVLVALQTTSQITSVPCYLELDDRWGYFSGADSSYFGYSVGNRSTETEFEEYKKLEFSGFLNEN